MQMMQKIAIFLKGGIAPFYQDLFVIDGFELMDENEKKNMKITYRFNGRRKVVITKKIDEIVADKKLLNCFSREDAYELGYWSGRLKETNQLIKES